MQASQPSDRRRITPQPTAPATTRQPPAAAGLHAAARSPLPTNDQVFLQHQCRWTPPISLRARAAGRVPAAGTARWRVDCRVGRRPRGSRTLVNLIPRQLHAAPCACSTPIGRVVCAGPVTNVPRAPAFDTVASAPARPPKLAASTARGEPPRERAARLSLRRSRISSPPICSIRSSTGIVVLDAQYCPIYANVSRAGSAGGEPAPGARPAVRGPVLRAAAAGRRRCAAR